MEISERNKMKTHKKNKKRQLKEKRETSNGRKRSVKEAYHYEFIVDHDEL